MTCSLKNAEDSTQKIGVRVVRLAGHSMSFPQCSRIDGWIEWKAFEAEVFYSKDLCFECKSLFDDIQQCWHFFITDNNSCRFNHSLTADVGVTVTTVC